MFGTMCTDLPPSGEKQLSPRLVRRRSLTVSLSRVDYLDGLTREGLLSLVSLTVLPGTTLGPSRGSNYRWADERGRQGGGGGGGGSVVKVWVVLTHGR